MSTENIDYVTDSNNLDELIFQHKNKEYGAYDLRSNYKKLLTKSFLIGVLVFSLLIAIPIAYMKYQDRKKADEKKEFIAKIDLTELPEDLHKEEEDEKIHEQEKPAAKEEGGGLPVREDVQQIQIIQDIVPEVVSKPKVETPPATVEQRQVSTTGTTNQAGTQTTSYAGSTQGTPGQGTGGIGTGTGTGTGKGASNVTTPGDNTVHTKLDKEAAFPGGVGKFRGTFQNNFDTGAVDAEGTIKATVSFVVERDGSITDIKVSGPNSDMNREATRTLRGIKAKWTPGEVNGNKVRSRFSMPISMAFESY